MFLGGNTTVHALKWAVLSQGMVTSDEPGVYIDGKYGIRIENEILCVAVVMKMRLWRVFEI